MSFRRTLLAGCLALGSLPAIAQEPIPNRQPAGTAPSTLKTAKDQISYSIGLDLGANLGSTGVEVDPALVVKGVLDALTRQKPQLTNEQIAAALAEFQKQANAIAEQRFKDASDKAAKEGPAFLAENKKKQGITTLPSGLQVQVLKQGTGPQAKKSDRVQVNYVGTFINGQVFDSNAGNVDASGKQQPVVLGVTQVIPGWTEALLRMKVGDKWKLFVPSELAYGAEGSSPIPGNSVLIFEVELVGIVGAAGNPANPPPPK